MTGRATTRDDRIIDREHGAAFEKHCDDDSRTGASPKAVGITVEDGGVYPTEVTRRSTTRGTEPAVDERSSCQRIEQVTPIEEGGPNRA